MKTTAFATEGWVEARANAPVEAAAASAAGKPLAKNLASSFAEAEHQGYKPVAAND